MISTRQLANALYGLRLLLTFDIRAWNHFDRSPAGFWGAFVVAFVLAPLDIADVVLAYGHRTTSLGFTPYLIVQVLSYVLSWVLFPFVMLYMARLLQRQGRYFSYMVPYIWLQAALGLFTWIYELLTFGHIIPVRLADVLELLSYVAFFIYGTFVAGIGLQVGTGTALSLAVLDFVLSLIMSVLIARI